MKRLGLTILCTMAFFAIVLTVYSQMPGSHHDNSSCIDPTCGHHAQDSATVSFGAWMTTPALDRFPNNSPTRTANHHIQVPKTVTIKAGGTVNFIIAGLHQVIVYDRSERRFVDNGTPQSFGIDTTKLVAPTGPGGFPPFLINDPKDRVYRGPDPSLLPADRVEVVHFDKPGLYLVICGILPHFQSGMFGFVRVLPNDGNSNSGH
ncbi:MAG: hypothetical protein LC768_17760 [Acidobacteria bacterium]|nr:hypothetical protein [Acidobacteriota bacterium]MCA1640141.1 hypothetical protein [Acidobacteriota bacterium]